MKKIAATGGVSERQIHTTKGCRVLRRYDLNDNLVKLCAAINKEKKRT